MRNRVLIIAAVAVALAVASVYLTRERGREWHLVQSAEGRFHVSFPGVASSSESQNVDAMNGDRFVSHNLSVSPSSQTVYSVAWWENPSQVNQADSELFNHLSECGEQAFHAKSVGNTSAIVSGFPAREFQMTSERFEIVNRVVRAGTRVYSAWVVEPKGKRDIASERRFLDSLSIGKL